MSQVGASPRSEVSRRATHLRALAARALRAMADKVEPVAAEGVVVRTQAYGVHGYAVFDRGKSFTT